MKKIIIFTFIFSSFITVSLAQLELKPAFGINTASFDSDPDSLTADGRAGYQIGASLAIGRKMYIEPGIFYNKMNQSFAPLDTGKSEFSFNTSYIRIPVNFGFQLIGKNTNLAGLRIYLGPSMFIPLNVKENSYPLVKENLKSPQFDISVGAGLNIWFLFLDVSYGWGLTPQFKDDPIEAKMQSFYANVGFRFKLKKDEE